MLIRPIAIAVAFAACAFASAQVLQPPFDAHYAFTDLGTPPAVPGPLGGLVIRATSPDTLLIGGSANGTSAKIYSLDLVRDKTGHIIGFGPSPAAEYAAAYGIGFGGIDGGLAVGPGNVLFYTAYNGNDLGQIKPGSTAPDLLMDLDATGIGASVGTLAFVPAGFAGAGTLKIASYSASIWYTTTVFPDGSGTYGLTPAINPISIGGGPEGILFVAAGNPGFAVNSALVCEYSFGRVVSYDLDSNSDPIVATRREFLTGVGGAEGAAIDPLTGDFLFSTFNGGNRVLVVRGFSLPCPADLSGNGSVGPEDLAVLLGDWGASASQADLDANGTVNAADLAILLGAWGPCG